MTDEMDSSKHDTVGMRSKKVLVMMLTTGVISSLLSIGATLYITKETTTASKEIERSKQKHEFYSKKFTLLSEFRNDIYSSLSQITNVDLVPLEGNAEKAKATIGKIDKAISPTVSIFLVYYTHIFNRSMKTHAYTC